MLFDAIAAVFASSNSIGLRGDARNDNSLFGFDVGSGIRYGAFDGIEVLGAGKSLLSGFNQVNRRQIESSLDYDSDNDGKGILFNLSPAWSGTETDSDRFIWESELVKFSDEGSVSGDESSISTEIGYGIDILDESAVITPYSAFTQAKAHESEFRFDSRIATGKGHNFELEIVREIPEAGILGHEFNLTGNIRW